MTDSYQPIYDAVRSCIGSVDVGGAVAQAIRDANLAHHADMARLDIQYATAEVAAAMQRPSVLYRPSLARDGSQWCALYGANLMEGVAGFGDTPAAAMAAFDAAWSARAEVSP